MIFVYIATGVVWTFIVLCLLAFFVILHDVTHDPEYADIRAAARETSGPLKRTCMTVLRPILFGFILLWWPIGYILNAGKRIVSRK